MIKQIDATQFDTEVRASAVPVLIEFFSDGCSLCKQMLPLLAEIAVERAGSLRVFTFNAGEDPRFAANFRIASVPNFILFQNGGPIGQRGGFTPKRQFLEWIDSAAKVSG